MRTEVKMAGGVDDQLDSIGVVLEEEFYCGICSKKMTRVSNKKFKCPECGSVYEE